MYDHENKKFKIVSLGCRTNQYEAQAYRDQLVAMGYVQAEEGETAGLCIVNTCTVTESADVASRYEIRQLAKKHPGSRLVVTGCSLERQPEKIKEIIGVTDFVSNSKKETLLNEIFPQEEIPELSIKNFDAHTRAFVKVQDGCDSFCTYCIIPYVRGRSRSRTIPDIIKEVEGLIANGFKEIVLTGINIGDFDGGKLDGKIWRLSDLVRAVDAIAGLRRLRLSSIDPDEVDDDLMDAILSSRHACPSLHIVLQSGSNVVLKRMNRKYTRQIFLDTIARLRNASREFTFTTDVIVGFPGETDVDFQDTLDVMNEVKFAKVHMFPYSPRPRTRAALFPNQVSLETMRERKQRVLRLSEQIAFELRQDYLNSKKTILTESDHNSGGGVSGHTDNFLHVLIPDERLEANQLVDVFLEKNTPQGLIGRLMKKEDSLFKEGDRLHPNLERASTPLQNAGLNPPPKVGVSSLHLMKSSSSCTNC